MRGVHPSIYNPLLRAEKPLNWTTQCDINDMFRNTPEIRMGLAATKGWAFVNPPTVNFPGLSAQDQKDFQAVVVFGPHAGQVLPCPLGRGRYL